MPQCILCRNERVLTEEHIVPECVGGSLKAKLLCQECNSSIGSEIEGPFSNTLLVKLSRQCYQIPGKGNIVPNLFGSYGSANHEGRELSVCLDPQFKPYVRRIVSEYKTSQGLEINITVDKEDEGEIETIIRKKLVRYYRSAGMPEGEIQVKVNQAVQDTKLAAVAVSHQPTIKYVFATDLNIVTLECIKITYEVAVLEFGETYVMNSPVAERLRCAIQSRRTDGVTGSRSVDFGPLQDIFPGRNAHYVLLLDNACVISIFGMASVVEYCGKEEPYARTMDESILYVLDPINQSHSRHSFPEYLSKQIHEKV